MNIVNKQNLFSWGLIGNKNIPQYSVAPEMWNSLFEKLDYNVEYFVHGTNEIKLIENQVINHIKTNNFIGCNVAMPWKSLVVKFCDYIEPSARIANTINTIVKKNDKIYGYNTDGKGIVNAIKTSKQLKDKIILVLGCGGASQTLIYHLIKEDVKQILLYDINKLQSNDLLNKNNNFAVENNVELQVVTLNEIENMMSYVNILINSTPCGMAEHEEKYPLPLSFINKLNKTSMCVEAVYNPYKTPLLEYAESNGIEIIPGVKMLVEQAALSFELAFNKTLTFKEKEIMEKSAIDALNQKNKVSEVHIVDNDIIQKILPKYQESDYCIKLSSKEIKIPPYIEDTVNYSWKIFEGNNSKIAKNNITYFLEEKQNTNLDVVFPNQFKYVQTFGKTQEFDSFSEYAKNNNLIALSSLCLILTSDNKLVFGIKQNMDNKFSGFSGYMLENDVIENYIDIYSYITRTIKEELNLDSSTVNEIIRIGQTFSPYILDKRNKLNNKAYNNIFLIKLNITYKNICEIFENNFQFKQIKAINNNQNEIINFVKDNYASFSIHCIGAIYNMFYYFKDKEGALKLKNNMPVGSIINENE